MHTKWKAILSMTCIILFLSGAFLLWGIKSRGQCLEQLISEKEARVHSLMNFAAQQIFRRYDSRIKLFLGTRPDIAQTFAAGDRQRLLDIVLPLYEAGLRKENPFFYNLHFHTPDNKSFLRVHKPEAYGDDLSTIRPMVVEANSSRKPVSGYELGRGGLFYRAVEPVFHQGRYVGTVEFGVKVQNLIEILGQNSDVEMALLIRPGQWQGASQSCDQSVAEFDRVVVLKCRENIFDTLPADFNFDLTNQRVKVADRVLDLNTKLALRDFRGAPVARLAFAMDITQDVKGFRGFILISVALTAGIVILAYTVMHFSFGAFLRRILELNRSLEESSARQAAANKELDDYRHNLEVIIKKRTIDLAKTNEDLQLEIVERKRAEEELRKNEASLAKAQTIARLGHWEWDIAAEHLHCSDEACRIFGVDLKQLPYSAEEFLKFVHQDDRQSVRELIGQLLHSSNGACGSIDLRIRRPDGEVRTIHSEAELTCDAGGRPHRMVGTVQDVTRTKQTNKQLQLWANVFENSSEGIIITAADGAIQMVNQAFTDITGYLEKEVVGENPRFLKSDRHDAVFFKEMWEALVRQGQWRGEIWNRRKNGEVYPQWLTINAIRSGEEGITSYVGVFHDMTEIKLHEEKLRYQAYHDTLTGLPNRLLFRDRLGVAMAHAKRSQKKLAVVFLDLDNFKRINDSLGHSLGDMLLKQTAKRLSRCMRGNDTVARQGGDEFIMVLEEIDKIEDATQAAQRIKDAIAPPFCLHDHELYLTVSIGITVYPDDGHDRETLIRNADIAMYRAKEEGRDNYQIFTAAMNQRAARRLAVENSLRKALGREEFLLYYQPKVNLANGEIVGVEALIRWQQADGVLVSPTDFISLAEDAGLIVDIGEWVIRSACKDAKDWLDNGYSLQVSVNLSPRQLRQQDLLDMVSSVIREHLLPPNIMCFEITEGTVMDNEETAVSILWELKKMGVGLAIDDFGTGYSSLYYLKQLPINELKIDQRFIQDLLKHEDNLAITSTIISMAKSLHLKVVAEGVETQEQLAFLRDNGCDEVQGYIFSKAVTRDKLLRMLKEGKRLDVSMAEGGNQQILPFE